MCFNLHNGSVVWILFCSWLLGSPYAFKTHPCCSVCIGCVASECCTAMVHPLFSRHCFPGPPRWPLTCCYSRQHWWIAYYILLLALLEVLQAVEAGVEWHSYKCIHNFAECLHAFVPQSSQASWFYCGQYVTQCLPRLLLNIWEHLSNIFII